MLVGLGDGTDYPEFHDVLVKLYAEFDAIQLRQFLHISMHVTLSKALNECQKQLSKNTDQKCQDNLNDCYQFILHRMGNFREALEVILVRLKNVAKAVQYVEKQADKSLWNELIERTVNNAGKLMPELLDAIKGHPKVDVRDLIDKIPPQLHIEGLRQKLIAIFEEFGREKSVTHGTTNILRNDCLKLKERLTQQARQGILINNSQNEESFFCTICNVPLQSYTSIYKQNEARMKKINEYEIETKQDINPTNNNASKLDRLMKFARMNSNVAWNEQKKVTKHRLHSISLQHKEDKKLKLVGEERLSLKPTNNINNINNIDSNSDKPAWKIKQLTQNNPSLKIFFCGHSYHVDCYRDAIFKDPLLKDGTCIRCQPKKSKIYR